VSHDVGDPLAERPTEEFAVSGGHGVHGGWEPRLDPCCVERCPRLCELAREGASCQFLDVRGLALGPVSIEADQPTGKFRFDSNHGE
jgi:hypothetical protein